MPHSEFLEEDLQRDEALRLIAYPDPGTKGPPWTIGYGHTGREVHPGLVWNVTEAIQALRYDIASTEMGLTTALPWFTCLVPLRQDCLINMAFNLGVHGLLGFTTFLEFVKRGHYPEASLDLRGTTWYHEVGDRAKRIGRQLISNEHQG
jgi:lysozyme